MNDDIPTAPDGARPVAELLESLPARIADAMEERDSLAAAPEAVEEAASTAEAVNDDLIAAGPELGDAAGLGEVVAPVQRALRLARAVERFAAAWQGGGREEAAAPPPAEEETAVEAAGPPEAAEEAGKAAEAVAPDEAEVEKAAPPRAEETEDELARDLTREAAWKAAPPWAEETPEAADAAAFDEEEAEYRVTEGDAAVGRAGETGDGEWGEKLDRLAAAAEKLTAAMEKQAERGEAGFGPPAGEKTSDLKAGVDESAPEKGGGDAVGDLLKILELVG